MKTSPQTKLIEEALREAAWKARHGTRDERAGKFLGKLAAVEKAVASVRGKARAARLNPEREGARPLTRPPKVR